MDTIKNLVDKVTGGDKPAVRIPTNDEITALRMKYVNAKQEHVFTFFDDLAENEKAAFFHQLSEFDPEHINKITDRALNPPKASEEQDVLEPLPESATASVLEIGRAHV